MDSIDKSIKGRYNPIQSPLFKKEKEKKEKKNLGVLWCIDIGFIVDKG
jgi:hypothetical protein